MSDYHKKLIDKFEDFLLWEVGDEDIKFLQLFLNEFKALLASNELLKVNESNNI